MLQVSLVEVGSGSVDIIPGCSLPFSRALCLGLIHAGKWRRSMAICSPVVQAVNQFMAASAFGLEIEYVGRFFAANLGFTLWFAKKELASDGALEEEGWPRRLRSGRQFSYGRKGSMVHFLNSFHMAVKDNPRPFRQQQQRLRLTCGGAEQGFAFRKSYWRCFEDVMQKWHFLALFWLKKA